MRVFCISIAVLVFAVASCGADDDPSVEGPATSATSSEEDPATATDDQPVQGSVTLRGDGLGVVGFGESADEVVAALGAVLGSPPTDAGSQAGWVEFVGWREHGLFVGFDTPAAEGYTGASRFVGWEYLGSDGGSAFATAEGAGIGTTLPELEALYGDQLEVSTAIDECVGDNAYPFVIGGNLFGALDRAPADDARVGLLRAGVGVGC
jgi:hypothetical protein